MAQPGEFTEPYRSYNFKLEVEGVTEGHFTECSGLAARVDTIKYREAGANQVIHTMPGQVEYADVVLRYGLTDSSELFQWFMKSVEGAAERKNVSIIMLDNSGTDEKFRWNLINAWPAEWQGVALDAMHHEVAIASVTLVYETLERD